MPSETSLPRLTARKAKNKQHSFTGFTQPSEITLISEW